MDRDLTSLLVLLILNTFIHDAVLVSQCDPAANGLFLFGPKCEYLCHCSGNQKCNDVTGACHNGCDDRWFGPACQYYDIAFNVLSRRLDNQPEPRYSLKANEGNPNTCSYINFESAANERNIPPYWIIFFQKDVYLSKIELQSFPSAIYQGYYEGFKIYIENYPGNKLSYTSNSGRNYIPPAEDQLLCYQHDGLNTPSADMAINCGRSLPGNSARIELRNRRRNFAFDKPASYSFGNGHNSKPGLAVDGIKYLTCVFVFANDPWWEVDLGNILQVNRIVISENNREFLSGFVVETAQVPGGKRTTLFAGDSGWASQTEIYTYIEARFVRITRPGGNKTLELCEVEVFAECRNLRWGDLCENKCGHCLDDYCYDWNGYCKNGCESGYKTTNMCLDECQGDTYGHMCHTSCSHNCKGGCNKVNGVCNGCADGWEGIFCDEKEEQRFTAFEFAVVAGESMGGCLLILELVFASVLLYRRYKSALKTKDTSYVNPDINFVSIGRAYGDLYEIPVKK